MAASGVPGRPSRDREVAASIAPHRRAAGLADGGTVQMPLTKTFFSQAFGMVADRFGVPWMVVAPE